MKIDKLKFGNDYNIGLYPKISVVLATYNGGLYLAEQMESILLQSYPNTEVIVVDDGSTDNTIEILKDFQNKYSTIKIFLNDTNLGYVKNFEKGASLATGQYIALCDQDDYWHPEKLSKMQAAIGDYPLIYCDSILCDDTLRPIGENISDRVNCRNFNNCLQQVIFCRIYGHATLIKKSFLEKTMPFLAVIPHDWWLCYMATFYGGIKYLPEPLASYRQHSANIFGAAGSKRKKNDRINKEVKKNLELEKIRIRINTFYNFCPDELSKEKEILRKLAKCYETFSIKNNFQRMFIFLFNYNQLLASKKRSGIRQFLFCLKMFVLIK